MWFVYFVVKKILTSLPISTCLTQNRIDTPLISHYTYTMPRPYDTQSYRYPNENLILAGSIVLVLIVVAFTAAATVCLSVVFVLLALGISYYSSQTHHQDLVAHAQKVNRQSMTGLSGVIDEASRRLNVEPVEVFLGPSRVLNAYTFGLTSPKAVVLYESLFQVMDRDEIQFIVGHELGHVKLGHTWLNSLVGGMAGIPAGFGASSLLTLAFLSWNRACEYSADRAGLLACAKPNKAISALVKLEAGAAGVTPEGVARSLQRIQQEDSGWMSDLDEVIATHPLIAHRIKAISQYAKSGEYTRLQPLINNNLS